MLTRANFNHARPLLRSVIKLGKRGAGHRGGHLVAGQGHDALVELTLRECHIRHRHFSFTGFFLLRSAIKLQSLVVETVAAAAAELVYNLVTIDLGKQHFLILSHQTERWKKSNGWM